jgi:hypothetical protein
MCTIIYLQIKDNKTWLFLHSNKRKSKILYFTLEPANQN